MTDHWCKYCNGVNTHNCQFNPNLPRMKIYTTNTAVVSDNEALPRQAEPATAQDEREGRAWPDVAGIGRDSEHPRAVVLYLRHEPSDEHLRTIQEALRTRPAQPAINGYTCTVPDDCETLHWRGQILSMNELASMARPTMSR